MILPEDVITKPIPTLSDRQFVVAKSDLTAAEQKVQQELFWYREELFKCIRGQWQEASLFLFLTQDLRGLTRETGRRAAFGQGSSLFAINE